jgi:hypothetical protein
MQCELLRMVKVFHDASMPDESERLNKLEGDFAKVLAVIQYLVTRAEGKPMTRENWRKTTKFLLCVRFVERGILLFPFISLKAKNGRQLSFWI